MKNSTDTKIKFLFSIIMIIMYVPTLKIFEIIV